MGCTEHVRVSGGVLNMLGVSGSVLNMLGVWGCAHCVTG
jgi:hypothetical protein